MINLQSDENSFFQLLMPEQIPQQQIKRFNPPLQSQLGNNKPKGLYLTGTLMPQLRYIHFFDLQTNDLQTFQLSFSLISEAVTHLIKKLTHLSFSLKPKFIITRENGFQTLLKILEPSNTNYPGFMIKESLNPYPNSIILILSHLLCSMTKNF
jgi:hypothetical protein